VDQEGGHRAPRAGRAGVKMLGWADASYPR
jgi:hypothetical protein